MSKVNISVWRTIIKVIMAVASTILGVLGAKEVSSHD